MWFFRSNILLAVAVVANGFALYDRHNTNKQKAKFDNRKAKEVGISHSDLSMKQYDLNRFFRNGELVPVLDSELGSEFSNPGKQVGGISFSNSAKKYSVHIDLPFAGAEQTDHVSAALICHDRCENEVDLIECYNSSYKSPR